MLIVGVHKVVIYEKNLLKLYDLMVVLQSVSFVLCFDVWVYADL